MSLQIPVDASAFSEADALRAMQQEQHKQQSRPRGSQAPAPYAQQRQIQYGNKQGSNERSYAGQGSHAGGGQQASRNAASYNARDSLQRAPKHPSNPMFAHLFPTEAV